jgi:hypothetical protein
VQRPRADDGGRPEILFKKEETVVPDPLGAAAAGGDGGVGNARRCASLRSRSGVRHSCESDLALAIRRTPIAKLKDAGCSTLDAEHTLDVFVGFVGCCATDRRRAACIGRQNRGRKRSAPSPTRSRTRGVRWRSRSHARANARDAPHSLATISSQLVSMVAQEPATSAFDSVHQQRSARRGSANVSEWT